MENFVIATSIMMNIRIKILLVGIVQLTGLTTALAHNPVIFNTNVRSEIEHMFEEIDTLRIPTGFLRDYATDIIDLSLYNGQELNDFNCSNRIIFDDIIGCISSAAVRHHPIKSKYSEVIDSLGPVISSHDVDIAFALFRYNYIVADALESNKLYYDANSKKVYHVYNNGAWVNPYGTNTLFAFSPSAIICTSHSVVYNFSDNATLRNIGVAYIYFDADDGNGYRLVPNKSGPLYINYSNSGIKILKLKVKTASGLHLEAHSKIIITGKAEISQLNENTGANSFTKTYDGETAKVTWFSAGGDNKLRKPLIFVEGFDPYQFKTIMPNSENGIDGFTSYKTYEDAFNKDLFGSFDYVYVDWYNSLADIKTNAQILIEIIKEINRMKSSAGSEEKNVIIGQSMGGLVTRWALKTMENNGEDHQVSSFVSHDVPHLGANVPVGAQYFIWQVLTFLHQNTGLYNLADIYQKNLLRDVEKIIYEALNSRAAKQMMYTYVYPNGSANDLLHQYWQTELYNLGFPEGINGNDLENIAIVNGRACNYLENLIDHQHFIRLSAVAETTPTANFLLPLMTVFSFGILGAIIDAIWLDDLTDDLIQPGGSKIVIEALVNPTISSNYGQPLSYLDVKFIKTFLWDETVINVFNSTCNDADGSLYYDEYPGSYQNLLNLNEDNSFSNKLFECNYSLDVVPKFTFIPTASALCIKNGVDVTEDDYKRDYYTLRPIPGIETPFDAYYLSDMQSRHIELSDEAISWMLTQVGMSIDAPEFIPYYDNISLSGYDGPIEWMTSDENIATIDSSGKLMVLDNGSVEITAQYYNNGKLYRKTKTIDVAFPEIVISKYFINGHGYKFTADSINEEGRQSLNKLVNNGLLQYEWSVIDDQGNMTTTVTSDNHVYYMPSLDEYVTVAVRLVDSSGNKSPLRSVYTNILTPFEVNYKYIVVNKNKQVYFVKNNNTFTFGIPSEDLSATFLELVLDSNDNSATLYSTYLRGPNCYLQYDDPIDNMSVTFFQGRRDPTQLRWLFDFFDNEYFLSTLDEVVNTSGGQARTMKEFDLCICDSYRDPLQRVPFTIIYNPHFAINGFTPM